MKITFEGTAQEIVTEIGDFLHLQNKLSKAESDKTISHEEAQERAAEKPKRSRKAKPEAADEAEEKPKRKRKAKDKGIPDLEMTKAASAAAEVLTAAGVMELLEQFGVTAVGDIEQDNRREFLDTLEGLVEDEVEEDDEGDEVEEDDEVEEEEEQPKPRRRRRTRKG